MVVPESSAVINVVLHTLYDISCAQYTSNFDTLSKPQPRCRNTVLGWKIAHSILHVNLTRTRHPFTPFTPTAKHDLYDLAAFATSYSHSIAFSSLTDEMAKEMSPVYLKRLFFLHYGRADALKRILASSLSSPHPHPPTRECDRTE